MSAPEPCAAVTKTKRYYSTTPAAHELAQQAREGHLRISSWGTALHSPQISYYLKFAKKELVLLWLVADVGHTQ